MSPRSRIHFAAAGAVCIGMGVGWWLFPKAGSPCGISTIAEKSLNGPTRILDGRLIPLRLVMAEGGREFSVAMDEFCIRGTDGTETFAKLEPPATPETLRSRMKAFAGLGEVLPVAYPEDGQRDEVSRRIITRKLRVKVSAEQTDDVAASNGLTISERPGYAPEWVILEAADPLSALAAVEGVRAAESVASADVLMGRKRFTRQMPNDTLINNQWHLKNATTSPSITHINVESVWSYPTTGAGVRGRGIRIGIVDDGMQTAHPDFVGNVDTDIDKDWNGDDDDPNPVTDENNHGTAVAGIAGARGNNNRGVSGVAPETKLVGMRLIASSPTDGQEASAMNHRNDIIQVKNNSWGPADQPYNLEAPEPLMKSALANAVATGRGGKGTIFVWAGGNGKTTSDNSNYDGYANSIETIAVGAINSNGVSSTASEPGANLLLVAPSGGGGTGLTTTDRTGSRGKDPGDYYSEFTGTSAATPIVSGVVALMLEKNPNLGWRDVQEILIRSATKVSPSDPGWHSNGAGFSFNHQFGAGLVNAAGAVGLAQGWANLPAQASLTKTQTTALPIPDNTAGGVAKTFTFTEKSHRVEHATVSVDIAHSHRGDLKITLVSPSGTESVLADVFSAPAANYNWTFSTVHHWGESARGTWTVKVADLSSSANTTGGTLGAVTLTLYGSEHAFPDTDPVVTSASIHPAGQAFADETLEVSSVSGVDPLGGMVSFGYQWQSSTDGITYADEPGETSDTLSGSPSRAGRLWRCAITPSNGTLTGEAHYTQPVNLLTRPPAFVKTGEAFSYNPGLVIENPSGATSFRLASTSASIQGLTMNATNGTYAGTVDLSAERGVRNMVFERHDSEGHQISFAFPLRVVAGNYAQWAGDHPLTKSAPSVDNDDDGIPNLVEYLLDLNADVPDTPSPVIFGQLGDMLTLTYRESKIPSDATLVPEWADTLGLDALWQSTGIDSVVIEEDELSRLIRASLPVSPGDPMRFLRLKATLPPP